VTETIQLDTHYDCTASHNITELEGPEHLASLMPGTIILMNGWEYMRLAGRWPSWVHIDGIALTHQEMWDLIVARKQDGWPISLLHVGAA
jgi:hypothetical protein